MAKNKKSNGTHKNTWHFYVGIFCAIGAIVMLFNNIFASLAYAIISVVLFRKSKSIKTEKTRSVRGPESFVEESRNDDQKKPVYKRWWFWALIVIILLGGKKNISTVAPETEPLQAETFVAIETTAETVIATETETAPVETSETVAQETTAPTTTPAETAEETQHQTTYILNTNSMKFHYPSCGSADDIKDSNKSTFTGTRDDLLARGYDPCGRCHP